ncbi:helix-turn-helix domain-containing protein [Methyloversatilis sp. MC4-4]|uniref:helix-turn-helix domain-containing protein n=1 Tax=Methyloversatilis sp. MC4-4 TaxID=3132824 RepID=UPI003CEA35BD
MTAWHGRPTPPLAEALTRRFGRAVRRTRELRGWSQEVLAERAELNRSYLGEVERGSAMPSLATVVKLALALELPAGDLLDGCERMDELPAAVQHTIA